MLRPQYTRRPFELMVQQQTTKEEKKREREDKSNSTLTI